MSERPGATTVYEIATQAGVSIATVSRVVNNAPGIRPGTRAKVLKAIEDLAYVPNGSAQGMARRSTGVLGLIYRRRRIENVFGLSEDDARSRLAERTVHSLVYYDELIRGVEDAAFNCARMVLLRGARSDDETQALLSMTGKCDGLVLVDHVISDRDVAKITRQVPVASIAHFVDGPGVTNVTTDNRAAMYSLVDHMVATHGARRFAFLSGPSDNADSNMRVAAVVERVAHWGASLEPLGEWRGNYTPTTAFDIVSRRCSGGAALPDVIMAANDSSAMGAISALTALGLRVPADVAVTGFDDMELASLSVPALTTMRQPIDRMAELAVGALAGGEAGQSKPPTNHVVAAEMIVRESCGCNSAENGNRSDIVIAKSPPPLPVPALPRSLTDGDREVIAEKIASLTIQQKAALSAGRDMWSTVALPEAGIPSWRITDGPNGARGTRLGPAALPALCLPCGAALGATWNTQLIAEVGSALGRETRARGARVLLGPTVNIQRSPLSGRTFECFSEDPLLAGRIAAAYVRGVQLEGVITTVKHFAGNEAEFQRNSINSVIDERSLREIYLAPFEIAVKEGGTLGIMTAYNRLNGLFCADNRWLLTEILRNEWGFDGITVSDWWALADTILAANAGLDLEMPGPPRAFGPALAKAVSSGSVAESQIDKIATRLLEVMSRIDALSDESDQAERAFDNQADVSLARRAAAESMVLMSNQAKLLPLHAREIGRIALIGPNADRARIMGGGSATLRAEHLTTPLEALREALTPRGIAIEYTQGCELTDEFALLEASELRASDGTFGLDLAFFGSRIASGDAVATHKARDSEFTFMGDPAEGVPADGFSLRASGFLVPVTGGIHRFRFSSNGAARLTVGGLQRASLVWEETRASRKMREYDFELDLPGGEPVELLIEFSGESALNFCQVVLKAVRPSRPNDIEDAVALAAASDVAVLVVGTGPAIESEGFDRTIFNLPGRQDELVRRVAAANPRTVVVVNSGSPVALPWLSEVAATLQIWFGGQEMAAALADVLLGVSEPGGRMPISVPCKIEHSPAFGNFPGAAGEVLYGEGVLVGYRWYEARQLPVAVPFGHGLGYSQFSWKAWLPVQRIVPGDLVRLSVEVVNVGSRAGSDVVQVYVTPPASPLIRAPKELRGFAKVHLEPGQRRTIEIELDSRAFSYWHPGDAETLLIQERLHATPFAREDTPEVRPRGWTIENGTYSIQIGRSSQDIVSVISLAIDAAEGTGR